eukprot:Ihof_evm5s170 gene=Ihof_evmTU5s170
MVVTINIATKAKASILATLLAAQYAQDAVTVSLDWTSKNDAPSTTVDGVTINGDVELARYIARVASGSNLYPTDPAIATQVDHWIEMSQSLAVKGDFSKLEAVLKTINAYVVSKTYMIGSSITLADVCVFAGLKGNAVFANMVKKGNALTTYPDLTKWYLAMESLPQAVDAVKASIAPKAEKKAPADKGANGDLARKDEDAKFITLPNAEMGKVVVRFPPEASGYLHIGHAKAALLNFIYAQEYQGTLLFRFDDTNPAKEKEHFEEVILKDMELLRITFAKLSYTSDYFDLMLTMAETMIKENKAYVDDTPVEKMREERAACIESVARSNSIERNLELWREMIAGSPVGLANCLRAKMDMKHLNGCMRDPVMYRCNLTPHLRTGSKYKLYPTYDFACPIVDSIEGVTHALRTNEYRDRQEQFEWFCRELNIRCPIVYDYSRLNMTYTLMSKRKLTWFVDRGYVNGWDDPRFPTVRGILRRGLTVEGLRQFILTQGASRSNNLMEWDKIWAINKKIIDPNAKRFTALDRTKAVTVTLSGGPASPYKESVVLHKKNPDLGARDFWFSNQILIEGDDAATLEKGEELTLMDWGNAIVEEIIRVDDKITSINMKLHLAGDFKKTKKKLTWLSVVPENTSADAVDFDFLITKEKMEEGDNFEDYINPKTEFHTNMVCEPALASLKKGEIIQLQRRGYFIVDVAASATTTLTLFNIPDGHQKHMSTLTSKAPPAAARREKTSKASSTNDLTSLSPAAKDIDAKIALQGLKIRDLKAAKVAKEVITGEVTQLLALKAEYKAATGVEWKAAPVAAAPKAAKKVEEVPSTPIALELDAKITAQGLKIRDLKAAKADKEAVTAEVTQLLALKAEYKAATGVEWKAAAAKTETKAKVEAAPVNAIGQEINAKITTQGLKIKEMKAAKADAAMVTAEVTQLLALKAEYKTVTGNDWKPAEGTAAPRAAKAKAPKTEKPKADKPKKEESKETKTKLGMQATKDGNFADWYGEVITKAELIEYHDVSGCYVLRPASFSIWEYVQVFLDKQFKSLGVQNCYFPMFVTQKSLQKEKDHIEDFAPEVAWVTKAGNSDLAEPIAIRPTSETVMYPYLSKWVQSHRDLPIKLNQWCNVVRWEFKHPQPFLRTREFLWQEGHTAHATLAESEKEVLEVLEFYTQAYEMMAVPVVPGKKTEKEKFAGAHFTTTIEAYIPGSGRAIQAATSHCLGQNFSKMFDITFQDPNNAKEKLFAWQNSWGFTTRSIGVMIMVHGDDKGLVLPPKVASTQVVIIPCGITANTKPEDREILFAHTQKVCDSLKSNGVRATTDSRDNYTTGWKFAHWEQKGIPLRMEIGPRDLQAGNVVVVRRDTGEKTTLAVDGLTTSIPALLETIHTSMYNKANAQLIEHTKVIENWDDFLPALDNKCLCLIPFCQVKACEEEIKKRST